MNPAPQSPLIRPPARRRPWFWIGLVLLLIPFVALGVIALGAASYLHLSSDMRALRNGLMKASGVEWRQNLGLNLGSMTLGVVRAGLSLAPLDAQARAAVQTLRGIEVGIYERTPGTKPPNRADLLAAADTVLNARGWERVVGVLHGEELVCVYVPATAIASRQVKCCVLVFDGPQMVVVSGRANIQPLWECLRHRTNLRATVQTLAAR
jgi:hypothetical protein